MAGLTALHMVVVGVPLNLAKQERGRRLCMARLFIELDAAGVESVWMESRRRRDNLRDLQAINAFRRHKLMGSALRVDHLQPGGPAGEPLLWVPDIVAGVISSGGREHRELLDGVLIEYRVRLD